MTVLSDEQIELKQAKALARSTIATAEKLLAERDYAVELLMDLLGESREDVLARLQHASRSEGRTSP